MKKIILFLLLTGGLSSLWAGSNGGYAGAFTRMGAGARARAMGNAYTGFGQGPSAIYFNPAALPFQEQREFSACMTKMALDRRLDFLAFSTALHPKAKGAKAPVNAGIGIGWLHGGIKNIDQRDYDGNPLPVLGQSSNLFMFGFGIQLHERFGAGVTAKVIYETFGKIGDKNTSVNGSGFGGDLALFARPLDHLTLGAQLKNLGAKTTWNTTNYYTQGSSKADRWPKEYRCGLAYQWGGITNTVDLETSDKSHTRFHTGVEGKWEISSTQNIAGRLGYDAGAVTSGIGLGYAVWKVRSFVDITYIFESVAPDDAVNLSWGVLF